MFGAVALALLWASTAQLDSKALFEKTKASVVQIDVVSVGGEHLGNGTGFVVEGNLVVTNHHVVDDHDNIELVFVDGKKTKGVRLIGDFPDVDIAVLQLTEERQLPALPIADSAVLTAGDAVAVIGSPMGLGWTLTEGKVAAYRPDGLPEQMQAGKVDAKKAALQLSVAIAPGNSGGPVLDVQGRVVGVIRAGLGFGTTYAFAVPTAALLESLATARNKPLVATVHPEGTASRVQINLVISVVVLALTAWLILRKR